MRCLALAEPWLQAGSKAALLSSELPEALARQARNLGIEVHPLNSAAGSPDDARETARLAGDWQTDWVVVDGYQFDADYQRALKAAGRRLLVLDDHGHAGHCHADFVLNQNLGASEALYPSREPNARLLLGTRYVQLRGEFLKHASNRGRRREEADSDARHPASAAARVLVTLGGSDLDNATGKIVEALKQVPGVRATVVAGASNPHFERLKSQIADSQFRLLRSAGNMPELMSQADVAIAAGGTTAWELCFMGVPVLLIALADNQRSNVEQLASAGVARNLGWHGSLTPARLAGELQNLLQDSAARAAMSERGRSLVDGLGSFRVWRLLNEPLLDLRSATPDDCRRVFDWANEPATRAASFSSEPIPWETHVQWFTRKLADPQCRLWIVEACPATLGQVRFDLEGRVAAISVGLDPAQRGRNLGALLIWAACRKLAREADVERIVAFIKPDNAASIRAFEKAGFARAGATTVNGQPALRFEFDPRKDADGHG